MNISEARHLIKNTFESSFTKESFAYFIKNLLKDSYEDRSNIQVGGQIPEAFENYIRKMERIGKYTDSEGFITDILMIELKRVHSVEFARSTQRNFIRRYLNGSRGGELKDAALVAFYTEGFEDWRFSLIKMQYSLEKKKDDLTPAKRFSFLVGKNEKSHTAQKQLAQLLVSEKVPSLSEIEASFNIETVTKEFFEKYKELFVSLNDYFIEEFKRSKKLCEELKSKDIDTISFSKKLLGQIVFLYFLQKKGWLGVPKNGKWGEGDKKFLRTLFEKAKSEKKNFFNDYLENLFYEALAEERKTSADPSYYKYLDCRIPFLNGGLFEAEYDWENITTNIPNSFFSNTIETKEGDIGNGILDVFDRYNFTVKEDEPLDKEVAVDPEMLGKVFENLLDVTDRKSKGAFYTPREIVHYMCQESLINYLHNSLNPEPASYNELGNPQSALFGNDYRQGQLSLETTSNIEISIPREDIEKFIREGISAIDHDAHVEKAGKETETYSYFIPESIRTNVKIIDEALSNIRVCDPAIGSGAFPVGMMNEIVKARLILKTYLPAREMKNITSYDYKRHCIQESIYGVDIEHSAVDIAKLRLWLSLVVDEEDLTYVKPLPNLDYKIVQGNSLIGMPYEPRAIDQLEILKKKFFDLTSHKEKEKYRMLINEEIQKIIKIGSKQIDYPIDFDFKLFFSEVFKEKKGFDVVIGNPPYVGEKGHKELFRDIRKGNLSKFYQRKMDLFYFFFHIGISLLRNKGNLAFITTNYYLTSDGGQILRTTLKNNTTILGLLNLNELKIFETAKGQHSLITFLSKGISNAYSKNIITSEIGNCNYSLFENIISGKNTKTKFNYVHQSELYESSNNYIRLLGSTNIESNDINNSFLTKIINQGTPLIQICDINQGILTGVDKVTPHHISKKLTNEECINKGVYVLTNEELKKYNFSKSELQIIKPWFKNSDIQKYYTSNISKYQVIHATRDMNIEDYPGIINHFNKFEKIIKNRSQERGEMQAALKMGKWWVIFAARDKTVFEGEKIVCPQRTKSNIFGYNNNIWYSSADVYYITNPKSNFHLKYILALLNSKLYYFWLYNKGKRKGESLELYYTPLCEIPIKYIPKENQNLFINFVDKILEAKKADPATNTTKWEKQIDVMVYKLYDLTYDEVKIIEPEFAINEVEYNNFKM